MGHPGGEELLAIPEAAAWLKCSRRALSMRVVRLTVPHRKDGKGVAFLRSELEAFVCGLPKYDPG
jgi:hypothetical protein